MRDDGGTSRIRNDDDQALDEFFEDTMQTVHVHFLTEERDLFHTFNHHPGKSGSGNGFSFHHLLRVKKSRIVCCTIRYGVPSAVSDISQVAVLPDCARTQSAIPMPIVNTIPVLVSGGDAAFK